MPSWRITFDGTGQAVGDRLDQALYVPSVNDILSTMTCIENTGTGGLLKLQNIFASEGSRGLRVETTASSSPYVQMLEDGTWGTSRWYVTDLFIPSGAAMPANWDVFQPREAATLFRCRVTTARNVAVVLGSSAIATSSMTLALDTHYRIAFQTIYSATVGELRAKIYLGNSSTPLETVAATGQDTGTTLCTNLRFGIPIAMLAAAGPFYLDNVRGTDGAEPGPSGAGAGTLQNGRLRTWNGSAWVPALKPKVRSGSAFVLTRPRWYN